jgi:hypothetical protein
MVSTAAQDAFKERRGCMSERLPACGMRECSMSMYQGRLDNRITLQTTGHYDQAFSSYVPAARTNVLLTHNRDVEDR